MSAWSELCWSRFVEVVNDGAYMAANDDFNAFRTAMKDCTLGDIADQSSHAEVIWEFLIGFAETKPSYRSLLKSVLRKIAQVPCWVEVYKTRSDLKRRASRLHEQLRMVLPDPQRSTPGVVARINLLSHGRRAIDRHVCKNGCRHPTSIVRRSCCRPCEGAHGPHADDCGAMVVVSVIRASLLQSVLPFGRMDLYVKVDFLPGRDDLKIEIGRTQTMKGAHLSPEWNHLCCSVTYGGVGSGDRLCLQVFEESGRGCGPATSCGDAYEQVEKLVADASFIAPSLKATWPRDIKLFRNGEQAGKIIVQIFMTTTEANIEKKDGRGLTHLDPSMFESPVKRLSLCGGTAAFFSLRLLAPVSGRSPFYWIGKDLSRAMDELDFYEQRQALITRDSHGLGDIFSFMFEYAGLLECAEAGNEGASSLRQLLVLQNLHDGYTKLRMVDIKVGEKTAASGWQGKSRFRATRQFLLDGLTNSRAEGFRLEGFNEQPPSLVSRDPLSELGLPEGKLARIRDKVLRIGLQRMSASEMFRYFFDVHEHSAKIDKSSLTSVFSPTEVTELVSHETVRRLLRLAKACRRVAVPQKWIGSSVAIGFDIGHLPKRSEAEETLREQVLVKIFDWGRSELNTFYHHMDLTPEEQADRLRFWRFYIGGITRLSWEAARHHWHRFGNTTGWKEACLVVYDFDSLSANDFIGHIRVPFVDTAETVLPLLTADGKPVLGTDGHASITYSISYEDFPADARLLGTWRVHVCRASNLPGLDRFKPASATSDPFVSLYASGWDEAFCHRQDTSVIMRNLHPSWDETLEIPVAREPFLLEEELGVPTCKHEVGKIFPSSAKVLFACHGGETEALALKHWSECLVNDGGPGF